MVDKLQVQLEIQRNIDLATSRGVSDEVIEWMVRALREKYFEDTPVGLAEICEKCWKPIHEVRDPREVNWITGHLPCQCGTRSSTGTADVHGLQGISWLFGADSDDDPDPAGRQD